MSLELLQANLEHPKVCPNPLFVMGTPRSGTHGLAYALAQHSHLWTHGESEVIFEMLKDIPFKDIFQTFRLSPTPTWATMYGVDCPEFLGFLGLGLNALFTSRNPDKRWIEKTPRYVAIADLLAAMFPGARFLHMVRDGRRTVHSMIHMMDRFNASQRAKMKRLGLVPAWRTDFREACRFWRRLVKVGLDFAARNPERCLNVINEELVADPRAGFTRVFQFIEEPFEEEPVTFFQSYRIMSSFSKPLDGSPRDFAKPLSKWTMEDAKAFVDPVTYKPTDVWREWTDEQRAIFAEEAGALMIACGFASAEEMQAWGDVREVADDPADVHASFRAAPPAAPADPLVQEIAQVVNVALKPDATVLVVSQGNDDFLDLPVRAAWHFPQAEGGAYADQFSTNGTAAQDHLEVLRARGADFLLVPSSALAWLDQDTDLRRCLDDRHDRYWSDERCVIYRLVAAAGPSGNGKEVSTSPEAPFRPQPELTAWGPHVQELYKVLGQLLARWGEVVGAQLDGIPRPQPSEFAHLPPPEQERHYRRLRELVAHVPVLWRAGVRQLAQEVVRGPSAAGAGKAPIFSFDVRRLARFPDRRPVFVVGAPRSGTTALGNALRKGAGLFGWAEGHVFSRIPFLLAANLKTWQGMLQFDREAQCEECGLGNVDIYQLLDQVVGFFDHLYTQAAARAGKDRWVDKTPTAAAVMVVPLLSHFYPQARFVYLHRHPVKRVLSRLKRPSEQARSVEEAAINWVLTMTSWEEVKKVLPPESFLELRQTDLSMNTDAVVGQLRSLLELTDPEADGVHGYLTTRRPEATSGLADAGEVHLEDVDWPDLVKDWFREMVEPTAHAWGYPLTARAPA